MQRWFFFKHPTSLWHFYLFIPFREQSYLAWDTKMRADCFAFPHLCYCTSIIEVSHTLYLFVFQRRAALKSSQDEYVTEISASRPLRISPCTLLSFPPPLLSLLRDNRDAPQRLSALRSFSLPFSSPVGVGGSVAAAAAQLSARCALSQCCR